MPGYWAELTPCLLYSIGIERMLSLSSIKDHTLRRLYKFILKRVLGQYLESELLLEVSYV